MADKTLKLEIITPERVALSDETNSIILPAVDGELGIWPNHAPLLVGLKPGVITYKTAGSDTRLFVSGGFAEVSSNMVSVIAPAAEKSSDIDFARAEAAKKRAQERLQNRTADLDVARAELALARAIARLGLQSRG